MKKIIMATVAALIASVSMANLVVKEFNFDGSGTSATARENWGADSMTVNLPDGANITGLKAAVSIDGSTTVLTATTTKGLDYKLYYRGTDIALPGAATGWDKLEIRLRQIGTGGTAVDFVNGGTLMDGVTGGFLVGANIPIASGTAGGSPVTVTKDTVNKWMVVTYDLSAELTTAKFKTNFRLDPFQGIGTNFEVDYIRLTAIPEPATVGMLGLGALVTLLIRRLRV
jgi:hypothetical protein